MAEEKQTITHITDKQDSIEVSKNSKGYTWSVKKYFNAGKETETLTEIASIDKQLKDRFGDKPEETK